MKLRGKVLAGAVGLLAACSLLPVGSANAEESADSVSLSLRQDTFFGFYAVVNGVHKITDNFGFAYGGWWYQDVRGNLGVHSNPWTEIDLGINYTAFDKRLSVTPMIGTVHGSLLYWFIARYPYSIFGQIPSKNPHTPSRETPPK